MYYKLVDNIPVAVEQPDWGEDNKLFLFKYKDIKVSTIFLPLDHGYNKEQPPVVFETMIFGGEHDQYQERYTNYAEAYLGHLKAVRLVHGGGTK